MSEINLEEKLCKNLEDSCIKAYKAGQQSMQAIIDDLIYKAKLRESDHQALLVKYQATKKCWEDMGKKCESLKAQLNNMEACYIQVKKERGELHSATDKALTHVKRQTECFRDLKTDAADMQTKNWWQAKVQILNPIRRMLEAALRGAND